MYERKIYRCDQIQILTPEIISGFLTYDLVAGCFFRFGPQEITISPSMRTHAWALPLCSQREKATPDDAGRFDFHPAIGQILIYRYADTIDLPHDGYQRDLTINVWENIVHNLTIDGYPIRIVRVDAPMF